MAKKKPTVPETALTVADPEVTYPPEADAEFESAAPKVGVPTGVRKAASGLRRGIIWLYGPPKIGKTTFASQMPGAWFLATEPGQEFVDIQEPTLITSWSHLLENCAWIEENKPTRFGDGQPIRTLVFDTVDLLFKMCQEHVCGGLNIEDPSELGHGKAWSRLDGEFSRVITKMARWPFSMCFISHARTKEFTKTNGSKSNRVEPEIGAAGMRTLNGIADIILYAYSDMVPVTDDKGAITGSAEVRQIQAHPCSWCLAGGRMSHRLPPTIPLGYDKFIEAFK